MRQTTVTLYGYEITIDYTVGSCTFAGYAAMQSAFKNNTGDVVEGPVEHFKPMPKSGHALESFDVNSNSVNSGNATIF